MRIACAALACLLAFPAAAQQPQQTTGPEAYRVSAGISVLAPIGETALMPATGLPSGRATISFQLTPLLGLQLGGMRVATTDMRLNGGVLGMRLNLTRGRLRLAPFAEGGYAAYDAVVDSGGVMVEGVYRPFRRPLTGGAPGGGGGLMADLILGPGLTVSVTGGYWAFAGADGNTFTYPMAGMGLRLARKDRLWYWRTSGHDRQGPRVVVAAPEPTEEGVVPVGRGEMRLQLSDVSLVDSAEVGGQSLALRVTGELEREAVVGWQELDLAPGENVVTVVAVDGAGNRTEHELRILGPPPDEVGPRIALEAPEEAQRVDSSSVVVRGVLVDESGIAEVSINGAPAVVASAGPGRDSIPHAPYETVSEFRADVTIGAGEVPLEVLAVDSAGNESWASTVVHRPDRKAPRIVVTSPSPDTTIGSSRARVTGWVLDEGQITGVTVNGVTARFTTISTPATGAARGIEPEERPSPGAELVPPAMEPGERAVRFEAEVHLSIGSNSLAVEARDAAGNEQVVEHTATRAAAVAQVQRSPVIRVEEPREWAGGGTRGLAATARTSVRVRGVVSDPLGGAIREVRINGDLAAVQSQGGYVRFTGFVPIQDGMDEVEVAAWTGDGRFAARRYPVRAESAPSAPDAAASGGFEGQRFAVVIGISDYADPEIPDLQYADDDARAFYEFLTSENAGAGGVPADHIELLLDDQATYRNLRSALFTFLEGATENDLVYVYVAAHGAPNPRRPEDLYLLPHDAEANDIPGTAFPMADVNEAIRRLYAHHTVLITDACHSGGVGTGGAATRAAGGAALNAINQAFLLDLGASRAGLAILTASEARELSQEDEQWGGGHGVFTHFLLEGLRGEADRDGDRIVRWGELTEYVRDRVARATRNAQHPSIGSQSHDRYLPMAVVLEGPGS